VAIFKVGGRRWILGAYGEVDWVRNLRAAGEATITNGGSEEQVGAVQLSNCEARTFFGEVLKPYFSQFPPLARSVLPLVLGVRDAINDPKAGADRHPVFEIRGAEAAALDRRG
jgi:hypothetical protein